MCGICGIVLPSGSTRSVERSVVERMRDVLAHRGPDDVGLLVEPGIGMGHRRLSIIDVAAGHQPMFSADGRYCIMYNGEIFNHPTLKQELERAGVTYRTRCDTETVLHLYAREGHRAVQRLRGMFAIALWDRQARELTLIRDRFGVKPLYYVHTSDGALYFASEMKALLAAGAVRPGLNRSALPDFLANHAPCSRGSGACHRVTPSDGAMGRSRSSATGTSPWGRGGTPAAPTTIWWRNTGSGSPRRCGSG